MSEAPRIGPWTVKSARCVYQNPWIEIVDHSVLRPDGSPGQYGVVRFKNRAIGILPIDNDGFVWLVGQHRFPQDAYSWELPEGGGALAEDSLEAAKRELAEETGLTAGIWLKLVEADLSNSVTDEAAVCYIAADLDAGAAAPEPSEELSMRRISFGDLAKEVSEGRIRDGLTVMMTFAAEIKALRGELPEPISKAIFKGLKAGATP